MDRKLTERQKDVMKRMCLCLCVKNLGLTTIRMRKKLNVMGSSNSRWKKKPMRILDLMCFQGLKENLVVFKFKF